MKRNKLYSLFGAAVLTLGIAGVALAATGLNEGQDDITLGSKAGTADECSDFPLEIGEGQVGLHFVLTSAAEESGLLSVTLKDPDNTYSNIASSKKSGGTIHWYVVVSGDADTILDDASTDATGNNLNLSHACGFGEEETAAPSFEQSEEAETDAPSAPATDVPTDEPSFEQSQAADTDAPSEPQTDALGTNGTSAPADGAWLLVVALGVLLASIVVLTPARAKGRR